MILSCTVAVAHCICIILNGLLNRCFVSPESRMHRIPLLAFFLTWKRRSNCFDSSIAIERTIGFVSNRTQIVTKCSSKDNLFGGQLKRPMEGREMVGIYL